MSFEVGPFGELEPPAAAAAAAAAAAIDELVRRASGAALVVAVAGPVPRNLEFNDTLLSPFFWEKSMHVEECNGLRLLFSLALACRRSCL